MSWDKCGGQTSLPFTATHCHPSWRDFFFKLELFFLPQRKISKVQMRGVCFFFFFFFIFFLVPTSLEYPVAMQCYKSWPGPGTFQFRLFCFGYNCSAASLPICFIVVTKSEFSEGRMRFDEREINKFNSGHVNQKLLMGKRGRWLGWWP